MSVSNLKDVKLQLSWANRHIQELSRLISDFAGTNPYAVFFEDEPGTGRVALKVRTNGTIPDELRMLTGDAIHNLRVPLDYLVCEFAAMSGKDKKGVMFPFGVDAAAFGTEAEKKLRKLDSPIREFIKKLEPYKGGKGHSLWMLHHLDIGHKHLDVVTLATQSSTRKIGFRQVTGGDAHIKQIIMGFQSLKEPLELMTVSKGATVNTNIEIETSVGFGDDEVAQGLEVLTTLKQIEVHVLQVIADAEKAFW